VLLQGGEDLLVPDPLRGPERARGVDSFRARSGRWSGFPLYEAIPEQLLLALDTRELLGALEERAPTPEEADGAARLFAGWEFQKARHAEIETFPPQLRTLLLEADSRTTDADRLARSKAAFGEG
jgi:hypothetical protein